MRKSAIVVAGATALLGVTIASAQERLPRECRQEIRQLCGTDRSQIRSCLREKASQLSESCRGDLRERVRPQERTSGWSRADQPAKATLSYGEHSRQAIDYYPPETMGSKPPLVLFIHGGGWSFGNHVQTVQSKPAHFLSKGYAFASTGYRLMPEAPVEEQARDIGRAIAKLRSEAPRLGFDPDRIVLMGHSAGAHLAALVSTDPQYAGADFAAIKGVVLLDGAGYDVPTRMNGPKDRADRLYANVFGDDPARQAALSPINHTGAPDAPDWLVLYVADRAESKSQSEALASKLASAGAKAKAVPVANTDHGRLNRELGSEGDAATEVVDAFLAGVFGD